MRRFFMMASFLAGTAGGWLFAAPAAEVTRPADGIRENVDRLGAEDWKVRDTALKRLLDLGIRDPDGVLAVLPAQSLDPEVRQSCAFLRRRIPTELIRRKAILEAAGDRELERAIDHFFEMPTADAWSCLMGVSGWEVRSASCQTPSGHEATVTVVAGRLGCLPEIAGKFLDDRKDLRLLALLRRFLCGLDPDRALALAMAERKDENVIVRRVSQGSLQILLGKRSILFLAENLDDPEAALRHGAASAIVGLAGDPELSAARQRTGDKEEMVVAVRSWWDRHQEDPAFRPE